MAQIQINPIIIWSNGVEKKAVLLDAISIQDNLETEAKFYYILNDDNNFNLIAGNISIVGDDYIQWLINDFSTNWIMHYIATQLNLTTITID